MEAKTTTNALDVQEGGNHYKNMAIQPVEFTHRNGLNFIQGNVIKYVTRYPHKNGVEDLKKARHYLDLLIQFESETNELKKNPEAVADVAKVEEVELDLPVEYYLDVVKVGKYWTNQVVRAVVERRNLKEVICSFEAREALVFTDYGKALNEADRVRSICPTMIVEVRRVTHVR